MRKLLMLVLVLVFGFNISSALEPVAVSIIKTDNTNAVAVTVELNNYTSGSAVNVLPSTSIGSLTPNSSGVISFVVDGTAWETIAASSVNSYYVLDVKVDGSLYAQYRLDELVALSSSAQVEAAKTYKVGDFAHGGIVAYVDASGKHGFVVSMKDISTGMRWWAGTDEIITLNSGIYNGEQNTMNIITAQGEGDGGNYAAKACHNYRYVHDGVIYRDWYLPNSDEFLAMSNKNALINTSIVNNGGDALPLTSYYWVSSTYYNDKAIGLYFNGMAGSFPIRSTLYRVRAIRAF